MNIHIVHIGHCTSVVVKADGVLPLSEAQRKDHLAIMGIGSGEPQDRQEMQRRLMKLSSEMEIAYEFPQEAEVSASHSSRDLNTMTLNDT